MVRHTSFEASLMRVMDTAPVNDGITSWQVAAINTDGDLLAAIERGPTLDPKDPTNYFETLSFTKPWIAHAHTLHPDSPPLTTLMQLEANDRTPGDGILQFYPEGYEISLANVASLALRISDNTAQRMWVRALGGPEVVNGIVLGHSPVKEAFKLTKLEPKPNDSHSLDDSRQPFYCGITNAREVCTLFNQVVKDPIWRDHLSHGSIDYGLRRFIEPLGRKPNKQWSTEPMLQAYLELRGFNQWPDNIAEKRHAAVLSELLRFQDPITVFPNKVGTDGACGEYHDVVYLPKINGSDIILATLCRNHPERDNESSGNKAYLVHAQLGRAALYS